MCKKNKTWNLPWTWCCLWIKEKWLIPLHAHTADAHLLSWRGKQIFKLTLWILICTNDRLPIDNIVSEDSSKETKQVLMVSRQSQPFWMLPKQKHNKHFICKTGFCVRNEQIRQNYHTSMLLSITRIYG